MKTVAIYSLYPRDDIEYFGVPSRRDLGLIAAGILTGLALMQAILSYYFALERVELLAAGGALLLALYVLVAGARVETAIQPGLLARRSWWQHVLGRDGQLVRFSRGDTIVKMPDGKWLLGGLELDLPCHGRDGRRMASALAEAGLVVDDRQPAWRAEHPRRSWFLRRGVPLAVVAWLGLFAVCVLSDGAVHLIANALRLLGPVALVAVLLAARAPRTKRRKVAPSIRHLPPRRHHRPKPDRLAA